MKDNQDNEGSDALQAACSQFFHRSFHKHLFPYVRQRTYTHFFTKKECLSTAFLRKLDSILCLHFSSMLTLLSCMWKSIWHQDAPDLLDWGNSPRMIFGLSLFSSLCLCLHVVDPTQVLRFLGVKSNCLRFPFGDGVQPFTQLLWAITP